MMKLKLIIISATILMTTVAATADDSCDIDQEQRINECERLLKQADEVIESKKQIIDKQDEQISKQLEILQVTEDYAHQVERERDAWYRSPYLTIPLGLFVGGFIVYEVRK